jgi:hypothetical protein
MSAIEAIRNAAARSEARKRYAEAHEHFAEEEQLLVDEGRYSEAEGAHAYALWCLRAYAAETHDPEPKP